MSAASSWNRADRVAGFVPCSGPRSLALLLLFPPLPFVWVCCASPFTGFVSSAPSSACGAMVGSFLGMVCDGVVFAYRMSIDKAAASFGVKQVRSKVRVGGVSGM
jgi:hypothetical protein